MRQGDAAAIAGGGGKRPPSGGTPFRPFRSAAATRITCGTTAQFPVDRPPGCQPSSPGRGTQRWRRACAIEDQRRKISAACVDTDAAARLGGGEKKNHHGLAIDVAFGLVAITMMWCELEQRARMS